MKYVQNCVVFIDSFEHILHLCLVFLLLTLDSEMFAGIINIKSCLEWRAYQPYERLFLFDNLKE